MLKCRDVTELTTDYLEGKLPMPTWIGMRWHLFICSMCRAYYDQLEKARRLLRGRSFGGLDPRVEARLVAARPQPGEPPQ